LLTNPNYPDRASDSGMSELLYGEPGFTVGKMGADAAWVVTLFMALQLRLENSIMSKRSNAASALSQAGLCGADLLRFSIMIFLRLELASSLDQCKHFQLSNIPTTKPGKIL